MKALFTFATLAVLALWLADCKSSKTTAGTAGGPATITVTTLPDPLAAERNKYLERIKNGIAGKENWPADSVFNRIEVFKKMPAERLLGMMDRWSIALGVACDHCHVTYEWSSEAKPTKEIARQMVAFTSRVNKDVGSIKAIKSEDPGVSCYTCHRGEAKPARRAK